MRDTVQQVIAHMRMHDGEDRSQVWRLAESGGWVYEPLRLFVTSAERGTILQAADLR